MHSIKEQFYNMGVAHIVESQNRAARIVTDSPYDAHWEPLISKFGWLTIKQLIDT